jgi:hypothetical protein
MGEPRMNNSQQTDVIQVMTGFHKQTRDPFVAMKVNDMIVQMGPRDAREIAVLLLAAAESSEQDAFIYHWTIESGSPPEDAEKLLKFYRQWKQGRVKA